jgi:hypothetical protein
MLKRFAELAWGKHSSPCVEPDHLQELSCMPYTMFLLQAGKKSKNGTILSLNLRKCYGLLLNWSKPYDRTISSKPDLGIRENWGSFR